MNEPAKIAYHLESLLTPDEYGSEHVPYVDDQDCIRKAMDWLRKLDRDNTDLREASKKLLNELDGEAFYSTGTANAGILFEHAPKLKELSANTN